MNTYFKRTLAILFFYNLVLNLSAQNKYPISEPGGLGMFIVRNADNKFGYVDYNEKSIIPFQFDYAESFGRRKVGDPGWATVAIKGQYGIIDQKGKFIIPAIYDFASEINNGFFMVQKNGLWGVIDKTGKITVPVSYDYIYPQVSVVKTMAAVKNKNWGVIKVDNTVLVPFEYGLITAEYYGTGEYTAYKAGGSVKINPDGKIFNKTDETFVYTVDLKYKLTNTSDRKFGLKNTKNEVILPTEYFRVRQLEEDYPYFEVIKDENSGLFNAATKEWILPFEFESIYMADKDILMASTYVTDEKSSYKYYDLKGKSLFNKTFDEADAFSFSLHKYALVMQGKYWGAIDKTGKTVLPFDLVEKPDFGFEKQVIIHKSSGFGVLNDNLGVVLPAKYMSTTLNGDFKIDNPFREWKNDPFFIVMEVGGNTQHGIIKKDGTMAVPFGKYERTDLLYNIDIDNVKNYYTQITIGDKVGVLNVSTNKIVVPPAYDYTNLISTRASGAVTVRKGKGNNMGIYFMHEQKEFISPEFTYYEFDDQNKVFVGVKDIVYSFSGATGKFGLVDINGKKLTAMDYDNISIMGNGYYAAQKNQKIGILDVKGNWVVPIEYDIFYYINGTSRLPRNPIFLYNHFYLRKGDNTVLFDKNFKKIANTKDLAEPGTSYLRYGEKGLFNYVESSNGAYNNPKPETKKWLLNNKVYNFSGGSYKYDGSSLQGTDRYWQFQQGMIVAMKDGKYGYLDYTGEEVIPFEFDEATSFELTGLASVKKNNEWFTINRHGQRLGFTTITTAILKGKK